MTSFEIDNPVLIFVIGLAISTIIIYIVTKLFRRRTNIGKAFVTALIGTLVWVVTYYLFGHVSPVGSSDNIFRVIGPGETAKYVLDIPIDHPEGTFWYHSHLHGLTSIVP